MARTFSITAIHWRYAENCLKIRYSSEKLPNFPRKTWKQKVLMFGKFYYSTKLYRSCCLSIFLFRLNLDTAKIRNNILNWIRSECPPPSQFHSPFLPPPSPTLPIRIDAQCPIHILIFYWEFAENKFPKS